MLLKIKINKMVLLWIILIIIGTILTIFGSAKLNSELSKKDILRQSITTPDYLLLDCNIEIELDNMLKEVILNKVLNKTEGQKDTDIIHLSAFFNQVQYEKNKISEENYSLGDSIYDNFKNIDISALVKSKDSTIILNLKRTDDMLKISPDEDYKGSRLSVTEYNPENNKFKLQLKNVILEVESKTLSPFITDLNGGEISLGIITNQKVSVVDISEAYLKTKKAKYFKVDKIDSVDGLYFKGRLNLLKFYY